MVMGMLMVACGTTKKSQSEEQKAVSIQFSADSAYAFCAAQCQYGPRTMNSEAHEKCGEWIVEKFKQYGCDVDTGTAGRGQTTTQTLPTGTSL